MGGVGVGRLLDGVEAEVYAFLGAALDQGVVRRLQPGRILELGGHIGFAVNAFLGKARVQLIGPPDDLAVIEGLFLAYFTQGRDIGDPLVLADVAEAAGMDRVLVLKLLSEGADKDAVAREHAMAVQGGVTGVPFVVFGGKLAVVGAETPEHIAEAIDQALGMAG
jgi:predicted DsbA family dithiol-disulfide isomerase